MVTKKYQKLNYQLQYSQRVLDLKNYFLRVSKHYTLEPKH
jgi:hypothetical protein